MGLNLSWSAPTPRSAPPAAGLGAAFTGVAVEEAAIDAALVERVQAGDKLAFDLLVRKYQHRIIALIQRFVPDWHEAQDVAQEAFIKAYRALPNFRGDSAFYTWLYKISVNTAKNFLVSQSRRPPMDDILLEDAVHHEAAGRMHERATPENEFLREEVERTVIAAVEELPEEIRTALTLREIDGLSYEEIAQIMNCPIGTVRSRIFRGRDAVDRRIRPLVEG
ncbi:MAG: RNA polymerase sigma factor RpoE [Xanthomonadales bacterium]|nr:RNA polymerase sigma factor RpoE [Xanthomonadales bacterium]MCB1612857.1 RNA polymerase sigma factor RpoE [Xanthomonadales bacterium]MCP5474573.1 RNA polymerase sigma factor RpoE [Rhodanobacteraceae bacterium]